jgi:uncharacterized protein
MVSNISVEYANAMKKLDSARTPEERLAALLEMKSWAPTHKGAENLRSDLNRKIAELRSEIERLKSSGTKKGSSSASSAMYIKKEGVGQVVLVGLPNSGKSWLLNKLIGKEVTPVTPYPFATKEPAPAMLNYNGGLIQLVELPALIEGSSVGKAQGKEILGAVRNSDAVLVCANSINDKDLIVSELEKSSIFLNKLRPPIVVKNSSFPGIQISGKDFLGFPVEQLEQFLKNSGFANSQVIISGKISSISEVVEALDSKICYKKAVFVNPFLVNNHILIDLKDRIFLLLDMILVFTKKPGEDVDNKEPISLSVGSTVENLAHELHKDFAKNLKHAKVWGSTKFPGQMVGPEYVLKNNDIVEIAI